MRTLDENHLNEYEIVYQDWINISEQIDSLPDLDGWLELWNISSKSPYINNIKNLIDVIKQYRSVLEQSVENVKNIMINSNDHLNFSEDSLDLFDRDLTIAHLNFDVLIQAVNSLFLELKFTSRITVLEEKISILFDNIKK